MNEAHGVAGDRGQVPVPGAIRARASGGVVGRGWSRQRRGGFVTNGRLCGPVGPATGEDDEAGDGERRRGGGRPRREGAMVGHRVVTVCPVSVDNTLAIAAPTSALPKLSIGWIETMPSEGSDQNGCAVE